MRVLLIGFYVWQWHVNHIQPAGGILSVLVMTLLKKANGFSEVGAVSIAGGIVHNGQLIVAATWSKNMKLAYYLPAPWMAGTVTGCLIGNVE